ncbi:MAG: hypothetical protein NWQ54_20655 [Paraglaciecola sp.]|uniref:hypothetical protein n=1 Tax=Pseudomonadati TaxID=3379134 RepID=UPI00273EFD6E|nr:hypothetical protein [Paraglaciecola sp.]MDP5031887.1 hypothetical protein [Paraglaciecola sp.]MDP5133299.1 hypothetical protein [Paraglaciecola sp.]
MKVKKENIPVVMEAPGMIMRSLSGLGEMTVVFHELPKGTDFTPLLVGLNNDSCHCPHWGYIFEGTFRFIYDDGKEETFTEGDVFYAHPGHTAIVDEDLKFIDFSPSKELAEVMENVGKVMASMG